MALVNGEQPPQQHDDMPPILQMTLEYKPVNHHWFFKNNSSNKWEPFSMVDSVALEKLYSSENSSPDALVSTDGGRCDVNVVTRERNYVYWRAPASEVRRCAWFRRGTTDGVFVPYEEYVALILENEYLKACEQNRWNRQVDLPNGDKVVFHGPDVLVLFPPTYSPDSWSNNNQAIPRPQMIRRGVDEFKIEHGESTQIDHLLFLVHGIGPVCDLKFQSVEEVVTQFRNLSHHLLKSHYKTSCDQGIVNRMEVLPVSWHTQLHSKETGVDERLKRITLESIPAVRRIANNTLSDVLFYTSPTYCQLIINTVATELNRLYDLFKRRNPLFKGSVSLGGHSLGSLILFDLLSHQPTSPSPATPEETTEDEMALLKRLQQTSSSQKRRNRRISTITPADGPEPSNIFYPQLRFEPTAFFALGSPIGFFITVRGVDNLGEDFAFPTCPAFYNIFHPFDPVAYRIEPYINIELTNVKPVLVPHHKGRKRIHLEVRDTYEKLATDIKQKVIDSIKSAWNPFYFFGLGMPSTSQDRRVAEEEEDVDQTQNCDHDPAQSSTTIPLGVLNMGRRIDYVLQETPIEFVNPYITAVTSHVCYWDSPDTVLLMLKEMYESVGMLCDEQVPQQSMTIERPIAQQELRHLQTVPEHIYK